MNITQFRKNLLHWFSDHKRDLPFRNSNNPYYIWLSEIMAQQTTMTVVVGYFERFIKRFPDLKAVANAKEDELLQLWQGLGYYSRVRNFQKACQKIISDHKGQIPTEFKDLKNLPGIGDYTAAAISSICFGEKRAVVDGNVIRVLSRVFTYTNEIQSKEAKEFFSTKASELLSAKQPGTFNEAMMELGALVCTPKNPKCLLCPIQKQCQAAGKNPEDYPHKRKQKYRDVTHASLLITDGQKILLKKPSPENLIKNMWELPSSYHLSDKTDQGAHIPLSQSLNGALKISEKDLVGQIKHAITDQRITTKIYRKQISSQKLTKLASGDFFKMSSDSLSEIALNTMSKKALKKFWEHSNN